MSDDSHHGGLDPKEQRGELVQPCSDGVKHRQCQNDDAPGQDEEHSRRQSTARAVELQSIQVAS